MYDFMTVTVDDAVFMFCSCSKLPRSLNVVDADGLDCGLSNLANDQGAFSGAVMNEAYPGDWWEPSKVGLPRKMIGVDDWLDVNRSSGWNE